MALDIHGDLAASSSTGGVSGKSLGRVGDSCLPGCGLYAGEDCAVSCSGHGEVFIRSVAAHSVAALVRDGGSDLGRACGRVMGRLPRGRCTYDVCTEGEGGG